VCVCVCVCVCVNFHYNIKHIQQKERKLAKISKTHALQTD